MSEHGGKTYRPWEPQRYQQAAHSPASKLPEGDLVFFLLDVVAKAQSNCTEPELPIMRLNNKGWEYCGNAPGSVDDACQSILACDVSDASNDQQQAEPLAQATLAILANARSALPTEESGTTKAIPATWDRG